MWGGWYADPLLMEEAALCHKIMKADVLRESVQKRAEAAVFVDETIYRRIHMGQPCAISQAELRFPLAECGIPCDTYLLCDRRECVNYKAVILPVPFDSPATVELKELCREHGIPVLQSSGEKDVFSPEELREFLCDNGVWCYSRSGDVFGIGNGYCYIHAKEAGEKQIIFPQKCRILNLCDESAQEEYTDTITVSMKQYETLIFRVE